MKDEKFVIRQSKKKQWIRTSMTGIMIFWYFMGPYEYTRSMYVEHSTLTIILGFVFMGLFFYFLKDLIERKAEIVLTKNGIDLRDKGFFTWTLIESYSTLSYRCRDNHTEDLILHFSEFSDMKFEISHLEKNKDELVDLIEQYKGSARLLFMGHNS